MRHAFAPSPVRLAGPSISTTNVPTNSRRARADTSNELSDYSVCTIWGVKNSKLYLLHVFRKRLEYPDLKRAVLSQAQDLKAKNVVIEDKASGTQLIQELKRSSMHGVSGYKSTLDKKMRMNTVTSTIENGFVYLPPRARPGSMTSARNCPSFRMEDMATRPIHSPKRSTGSKAKMEAL